MRKNSQKADISDSSAKDKYEQVYDDYLNNISSVPGFKNRSSGVRAILNFSQAQQFSAVRTSFILIK